MRAFVREQRNFAYLTWDLVFLIKSVSWIIVSFRMASFQNLERVYCVLFIAAIGTCAYVVFYSTYVVQLKKNVYELVQSNVLRSCLRGKDHFCRIPKLVRDIGKERMMCFCFRLKEAIDLERNINYP